MSARCWVFSEPQLRAALRDWRAELERADDARATQLQLVLDFLASTSARRHKLAMFDAGGAPGGGEGAA